MGLTNFISKGHCIFFLILEIKFFFGFMFLIPQRGVLFRSHENGLLRFSLPFRKESEGGPKGFSFFFFAPLPVFRGGTGRSEGTGRRTGRFLRPVLRDRFLRGRPVRRDRPVPPDRKSAVLRRESPRRRRRHEAGKGTNLKKNN